MTPRPCLACATLLAALFLGRPAAAQLSGDSAAVAGAVAGVVGDSLLPRLAGQRLLLGQPTTPFDWEVTLLLRDAHGLELMPAERPVTWVVTRGVALSGDSAAVRVEVGDAAEQRPDRSIDTYVETWRYLFARGPEGWRLVHREFVSGADLGRVRG